MKKEALKQQAIKYLNQNMVEDDYIGSAVFALFEEASQVSNNKTELSKKFVTYCNQELGRAYLIGDAIYLILKDFIKDYNQYSGMTGKEYATKTLSSTKKAVWIFRDVTFNENDIITPLEMDRIQTSIIATVRTTKDTDYIYMEDLNA